MNYRKINMKILRMAGLTYDEIGKKFGISRQRVHQILKGYLSPAYYRSKKKKKK